MIWSILTLGLSVIVWVYGWHGYCWHVVVMVIVTLLVLLCIYRGSCGLSSCTLCCSGPRVPGIVGCFVCFALVSLSCWIVVHWLFSTLDQPQPGYLANPQTPQTICPFTHYTLFFFIHMPCIYLWPLIVPLQTREALSEEVAEQRLNIIDSVSFPTDQNPQPFVLKLQVGSGE